MKPISMIASTHIHMHTGIDPSKLNLWKIHHHKLSRSTAHYTYNLGIRLHNFSIKKLLVNLVICKPNTRCKSKSCAILYNGWFFFHVVNLFKTDMINQKVLCRQAILWLIIEHIKSVFPFSITKDVE